MLRFRLLTQQLRPAVEDSMPQYKPADKDIPQYFLPMLDDQCAWPDAAASPG